MFEHLVQPEDLQLTVGTHSQIGGQLTEFPPAAELRPLRGGLEDGSGADDPLPHCGDDDIATVRGVENRPRPDKGPDRVGHRQPTAHDRRASGIGLGQAVHDDIASRPVLPQARDGYMDVFTGGIGHCHAPAVRRRDVAEQRVGTGKR